MTYVLKFDLFGMFQGIMNLVHANNYTYTNVTPNSSALLRMQTYAFKNLPPPHIQANYCNIPQIDTYKLILQSILIQT